MSCSCICKCCFRNFILSDKEVNADDPDNNLIINNTTLHPNLIPFVEYCKFSFAHDFRDCYILTVQKIGDGKYAKKRIVRLTAINILKYIFKSDKAYYYCSHHCMRSKFIKYMENLISLQFVRVPPLSKEEAKEYIKPFDCYNSSAIISPTNKPFPYCDEDLSYDLDKAKLIYEEYIEHYYGDPKEKDNYRHTFLSCDPFVSYMKCRIQSPEQFCTYHEVPPKFSKPHLVDPTLNWCINSDIIDMIKYYKHYLNVKNIQKYVRQKVNQENMYKIMRFLIFLLGFKKAAYKEYDENELFIDINHCQKRYIDNISKRMQKIKKF